MPPCKGGTGELGAGGGHKASGRCKGSSTARKRSTNSASCNSATQPALTSHQGKLHLSNCNITGKTELGKKGRNINLPLLLFSESSNGKSRLKGLQAQSCYFCLESSHKKRNKHPGHGRALPRLTPGPCPYPCPQPRPVQSIKPPGGTARFGDTAMSPGTGTFPLSAGAGWSSTSPPLIVQKDISASDPNPFWSLMAESAQF